MSARKRVPARQTVQEVSVAQPRYYIAADKSVTLPNGVTLDVSYEWHCVFEPRIAFGEAAYEKCLNVWKSLIVPNTTEDGGDHRYRYRIFHDWGTGSGDVTKFRYSDQLFKFDQRFKEPTLSTPRTPATA